MSLKNKIRRFLGLPTAAEVIPNTKQGTPHREANHYVRVDIGGEPHLFTTSQIRVAKQRAIRNPEDL